MSVWFRGALVPPFMPPDYWNDPTAPYRWESNQLVHRETCLDHAAVAALGCTYGSIDSSGSCDVSCVRCRAELSIAIVQGCDLTYKGWAEVVSQCPEVELDMFGGQHRDPQLVYVVFIDEWRHGDSLGGPEIWPLQALHFANAGRCTEEEIDALLYPETGNGHR
jgi:hypothetical protein